MTASDEEVMSKLICKMSSLRLRLLFKYGKYKNKIKDIILRDPSKYIKLLFSIYPHLPLECQYELEKLLTELYYENELVRQVLSTTSNKIFNRTINKDFLIAEFNTAYQQLQFNIKLIVDSVRIYIQIMVLSYSFLGYLLAQYLFSTQIINKKITVIIMILTLFPVLIGMKIKKLLQHHYRRFLELTILLWNIRTYFQVPQSIYPFRWIKDFNNLNVHEIIYIHKIMKRPNYLMYIRSLIFISIIFSLLIIITLASFLI